MTKKPPKLPAKRHWRVYRRWLKLPPTVPADYALDVKKRKG